MKRFMITAMVLGLSVGAFAHERHEPVEKRTEDARKIEKIVRRVAKAWGKADGKTFRRYYVADPKIRIIESGGQNTGVEDLVENHVLPEWEHFKKMKVTIHGVDIFLSEDRQHAWSISDNEFKAETHKGRKIHSRGFETVIWAKVKDDWRIVHSHSSSRRVKH
ncbi:MAG: hypothetical protein COB53_11345 [Elusimicrobia bacterium]|nr:MAG: hypothetical protein COB53_11345 [Elusimicrobiota bacterium]